MLSLNKNYLKEYNDLQVECIREYIKKRGGNPDDKTNKKTIGFEMEWVEKGFSKRFREEWNRQHGVFSD